MLFTQIFIIIICDYALLWLLIFLGEPPASQLHNFDMNRMGRTHCVWIIINLCAVIITRTRRCLFNEKWSSPNIQPSHRPHTLQTSENWKIKYENGNPWIMDEIWSRRYHTSLAPLRQRINGTFWCFVARKMSNDRSIKYDCGHKTQYRRLHSTQYHTSQSAYSMRMSVSALHVRHI